MSSDTVPVTQADRELFNLLFRIPDRRVRDVLDGSQDHTEEMQAIARHRATPTPSPAMPSREERAAIAEAIGSVILHADTANPVWRGLLLDQVLAALTSVDRASTPEGAIPAGMVPWAGGDGPPEDWDGGPVLYRNRIVVRPWADWRHAQPDGDIIAYTPKAIPTDATSKAVEIMGEALFGLSEKLRAVCFFADDGRHAAYEKVVAAWKSLTDSLEAAALAASPVPVDASGVDFEPDLGAPTFAPSLRQIVYMYYRTHFAANEAWRLTGLYLAALTTPTPVAVDREAGEGEGLARAITEAKLRLSLTQGCLDCNADDERRWLDTIRFLEGMA